MMCAIQTQAEAVCGLFDGKKEEIKVIGIRYDEKMYEILLINKKCAKVVDMDDFYCVLGGQSWSELWQYFKEDDEKRNTFTEFNSNNTR